MKKVTFFLLLLVIPVFSCFAGSFYSNIVVMSIDAHKIVPLLMQMGISAYYVIKDHSIIIFEKKLDEQDTDYGINLTKKISNLFNSITVYTTIHDSDILMMYIYKGDKLIFSYNSNPGYFDGEDIPPEIKNIDTLLNEFPLVKKEELLEILRSEETFAEELHDKIITILNIPSCSVGFGYMYLDDDEERKYFENDFKIKVEKIENN